MTEYLCLTVRSNTGESETVFKARLVEAWSRILREMPEEYETVFAEAKGFEYDGDQITRQYMVESETAETLRIALQEADLSVDAPDPDDLYSKYEATGSEWFQIPH